MALPAPHPREALESWRPRGGYCVSCQMTSRPFLTKGKIYVLAGERLYTLFYQKGNRRVQWIERGGENAEKHGQLCGCNFVPGPCVVYNLVLTVLS